MTCLMESALNKGTIKPRLTNCSLIYMLSRQQHSVLPLRSYKAMISLSYTMQLQCSFLFHSNTVTYQEGCSYGMTWNSPSQIPNWLIEICIPKCATLFQCIPQCEGTLPIIPVNEILKCAYLNVLALLHGVCGEANPLYLLLLF